jgi:hypothetical protein
MTLAEHHAQLKAEGKWDEHIARKQEQANALAKKREELRTAEASLVEDLRSTNIDVGSVWDLVNTSEPYPEAIPVLLKHLRKTYPERIEEGIVRALAVPYARSAWKELLQIFENEPSMQTGGLKWPAACALGAIADDSVIPEVIRLVRDVSLGFDRAPLIEALKRSQRSDAKMVLNELRADPVIGKEVKKARRLGRLWKKGDK